MSLVAKLAKAMSIMCAGMGDDFASAGELVRCMKPGLLLNAATIPQVRPVTRHGLPVALNRYVLDYWQHGQKQALVQANHLREGTDAHSCQSAVR